MLAHVLSATVLGIEAAPIHVEVDVANGLPGCHIVGLPDAGVKEGRVRIRGAIENSGFKYPLRRITVNLAPADLRKDGAAFDVPIAIGILSAAGAIPAEVNENSLFVGELALDGAKPTHFVIAASLTRSLSFVTKMLTSMGGKDGSKSVAPGGVPIAMLTGFLGTCPDP